MRRWRSVVRSPPDVPHARRRPPQCRGGDENSRLLLGKELQFSPEPRTLKKRTLATYEKLFGSNHSAMTAIGLNNLANVYANQGRALEAAGPAAACPCDL